MLKAVLMATLLATGTPVSAAEPEVTTLIFVNAAEMESSPSADPGLSATGLEQATQLASSLEGTEISAIYTTYLNRAVQTVTPLSKAHQQQLDYFRLNGDPEQTTATLKDMIKKNKGKTIVICSVPENITAMLQHAGVKGKIMKTLYDKGSGQVLVVKHSGNNTAVAQKLNMNIQKKV
ncbi:Broad specificity phosphatase PhoE [Chitinophaga ginsengisegetis]|uniref:Broad specificity phosphatase PhoE n=1 Tax=Chitinophaga ginsengisegetis TaxID=393003 RepID=A0A1T5N2K6_9BACT|nr:phosphoglycerate mutase family protein [Chitinophaga ginsengisegetis]MDR6567592.1 broad specificity phosphatase PhoE [Chitinophaga ginsengisegetis]MDR6647853.1 broad specificity phosphatase PhoE [Chitinophaga ginsengisegetis]MDR6654203.1 broad specificity phosphatase PhoE [Chitinophaga ginsengisegetis]SKC94705.1 Broad specificity phosphatase PhoE [Chitinophaga ginsengisegetis]